MNEWKPVVGGRALWAGRTVLVVQHLPWGDWLIMVRGGDRRVYATDLREHPDDRRARRLLEAAREVRAALGALERGEDRPLTEDECERLTEANLELRAIVAEIDQAEASHA